MLILLPPLDPEFGPPCASPGADRPTVGPGRGGPSHQDFCKKLKKLAAGTPNTLWIRMSRQIGLRTPDLVGEEPGAVGSCIGGLLDVQLSEVVGLHALAEVAGRGTVDVTVYLDAKAAVALSGRSGDPTAGRASFRPARWVAKRCATMPSSLPGSSGADRDQRELLGERREVQRGVRLVRRDAALAGLVTKQLFDLNRCSTSACTPGDPCLNSAAVPAREPRRCRPGR